MYVYICTLCFSTGMLTLNAKDCLVRTDYVDECVLPPTIRTPSICGKSFSFGEERIGPICYRGIASSNYIMK
jgi:hypothetical protein